MSQSQRPARSALSAQPGHNPSYPSPPSAYASPHSLHSSSAPALFSVSSMPEMLPTAVTPLTGKSCNDAKAAIIAGHYAHSVSSGKTFYFSIGTAYVAYSIPANKNIARYITGRDDLPVWELSRLWAPDGHEPNLLTHAIALSAKALARFIPLAAIVSYADPNVGHTGGIYRAASWTYLGQCEESRYYRLGDQVVSRRKFHSGRRGLTKAEILALGYTEEKLPGKHRYARGMTHGARKAIHARAVAADRLNRKDRAA